MSEVNFDNARTKKEGIIDWQNLVSVATYGVDLQKEAKGFVKRTQEVVANNCLTGIETTLSDIVQTLQLAMQSDNCNTRRKSRRTAHKLAGLVDDLDVGRIGLLRKMRALDRLYQDECKVCLDKLDDRITVGQLELESARTNDLETLRQKMEATGSQADAMNYGNLHQALDAFEERLQSLRLTRSICQQASILIQQTRESDMQLAQAIQNSGVNDMIMELQGIVRNWPKTAKDASAAQNTTDVSTAVVSLDILKQVLQQAKDTATDAVKNLNS